MLTILLDDGSPVPAGAMVQIDGRLDAVPVGMHGETYLTGLSQSNQVRLTWGGQTCQMMVLYLPSDEPIAQLGVYTCSGVKP